MALVPVAPFQQLTFAVAMGVLLDAFVVRSFLVPALISLVGRASGWPGRRLRATPADDEPPPTDDVADLVVRTGEGDHR